MQGELKNKFVAVTMVTVLIAISLIVIFTPVENEQDIVDYSDPDNWLSLPSSTSMDVDVFYLYPNVWARSDENASVLSTIDDPMMLAGANEVFQIEASAFDGVANIYAPYYRQVDGTFTLFLSYEEQDALVGDIPASDAISAFDYYINNYNDGRPFILAGHSLGSHVLLFLLSEYMRDNPDVYDRMIAAYIIGYSVTEDYLEENPHLRFAEGANDTGVIISYNTEAPGYTGFNPVLRSGAIAINPISWTRNETLASADENLGSVVIDQDGNLVSVDQVGYADAQVDLERGVVVCSTVDPDTLPYTAFPTGVYHSFDYTFYYHNIGQNAMDRALSYLAG